MGSKTTLYGSRSRSRESKYSKNIEESCLEPLVRSSGIKKRFLVNCCKSFLDSSSSPQLLEVRQRHHEHKISSGGLYDQRHWKRPKSGSEANSRMSSPQSEILSVP